MPGTGLSGQPERQLPVKTPEQTIKEHRRCRSCWGNGNGVGIATGTQGSTRYYRCQKHIGGEFYGDAPEDFGKLLGGGCGHTWNVKLAVVTDTIVIGQMIVPVAIRDVQIQAR